MKVNKNARVRHITLCPLKFYFFKFGFFFKIQSWWFWTRTDAWVWVLSCDTGLGAGGKSKQRSKGLEQFHPAWKRERGVIFPLYIFHTVSYVCLFLDSISKDSIVSSTISSFPYHSAHQPLTLPIWFHNDSNFQHCIVWRKNHSEHWIELTTPAHPRTIRESLSQSNSMATRSWQHRQEWQCQKG